MTPRHVSRRWFSRRTRWTGIILCCTSRVVKEEGLLCQGVLGAPDTFRTCLGKLARGPDLHKWWTKFWGPPRRFLGKRASTVASDQASWGTPERAPPALLPYTSASTVAVRSSFPASPAPSGNWRVGIAHPLLHLRVQCRQHRLLSQADSISVWPQREPPSRWTRSWPSGLISSASASPQQHARESLMRCAPRWNDVTERRT